MGKKCFNLFVISVVLFAIGTLMHFGTNVFGTNAVTSVLFPVDESVFQHLKLGAYPLFGFWLLFAIRQKQKGNKALSVLTAAFVSVVVLMVFVVAFYYTYTGAFGVQLLVLDILSLFVGIVLALKIGSMFVGKQLNTCVQIASAVGIAIIIFGLVFFTFVPPALPLFISPH